MACMILIQGAAFLSGWVQAPLPQGTCRGVPCASMPHLRMAAAADTALEELIAANQPALSAMAASSTAADEDELMHLRFALAFPEEAERTRALEAARAWRAGDGKSIVESAKAAVAAAAQGGGWDNEPVAKAAPHSASIGNSIGSSQILTLATPKGDLVFAIRASAIDENELMSGLTEDELVEFFLYTKEVHRLVCDARSRSTGRLNRVITANDLSGLGLFSMGGESKFRNALSASSKQAADFFPGIAGPTLLLNLPKLLSALVSLFKPLFPPAVQARIRFESGPLKTVKDLATLTTDQAARKAFLQEVQDLV